MATNEALKVDVTGNGDLSKIYRHKAVLSSDSLDWGGLYLQYHLQPPPEMVEHACPQHRLIINDRALRSPITETFEGQNQFNPVSPGTVRVLPANARTSAYWETEHQFVMLAFEPELLTRQIIDTTNDNPVELLPIINPSDPLIYHIGLTLKAELESGGIGGRLYVDAMTTALMAHLLRHYSAQNAAQNDSLLAMVNGLPKRVLRQVVDYIHDHLDQDLALETLGAIAHMSPSYFSRLFKQSTGLSPHQYVIRCRIDRAKQLLLQGKLSIAEIAYRLGFTHQSHFSHHFKRIVGINPKAFLKAQ